MGFRPRGLKGQSTQVLLERNSYSKTLLTHKLLENLVASVALLDDKLLNKKCHIYIHTYIYIYM